MRTDLFIRVDDTAEHIRFNVYLFGMERGVHSNREVVPAILCTDKTHICFNIILEFVVLDGVRYLLQMHE